MPKFSVRKKMSISVSRDTYIAAGVHLCRGCGETFDLTELTVDHLWPVSKGGSDELSNLQLLCGPCNSTKGAATPGSRLPVLSK